MPSLQTFLRDLRNSTQIKTPSETLLPLFELLSGNKGFESFSSVLQISRKWFNFQHKSSRDFKQ